MSRPYPLLTLLIFTSISYTLAQSKGQKLLAKDAKVTQVAAAYKFTEGPAVDPKGNVYFTDQPNDRIIKWSTDGKVATYMEGTGRSNGLYFDNDGNLLACADQHNQLWKIDSNKKVTVLVKDFKGKKFNGPNDLWVDPDGGIYFTDPYYKRSYWTNPAKELEKQDVYYLSPNGTDLRVVATNLVQPNGIVGSRNGKKLYVADIGDGKTYVYDIVSNGVLENRQLFTNLGSDGMTIDNKGNLYLTGKGVTVFNKKGKKILQIPIEEKWTANVCFGGKKQKTLFITAMKSLYTLEMSVKGIR